ncbi:hypothetical protein Q7C36_007655 [Tachysurus vachellii]|uniref:Uncharacterized protein n=1 Tax=Tachysurus vachellii TaxID=175792 RepID=A0AA88N5V6_TACVA|nr:hypothetical protein Q7C36_007655 [Tachysurus vachellii]
MKQRANIDCLVAQLHRSPVYSTTYGSPSHPSFVSYINTDWIRSLDSGERDYVLLAWPGWISAGGAVLAPVVVNLREAIAESCIRRHPHFSVTGNTEGCVT